MFIFIFRLMIHLSIELFVILPLEIIGWVILLTGWVPKWYSNYHNEGPTSEGLPDTWWSNYVWLAWRNPLNYFHYVVLGKDVNGFNVSTITFHSFSMSRSGGIEIDNASPGYMHLEVEDVHAYEYYCVAKWPGLNKIFRFRMGWKISSRGNPKQWVLVLQPFISP